MSKIFISGSADSKGLGMLAAKQLIANGHHVTLHARNAERAADAKKACPEASEVLVADLSSTEDTRKLADELNSKGPWDCIVHNAALYRATGKGKEGLQNLFAVNTLAPYMLACLVNPPKRLVFVSSGAHYSGDASLRNIQQSSYGDSKMHDIMLAQYFSRQFRNKGVEVNSLDPGWVQTKMGGASATDDLQAAVRTYTILADGSKVKGQTGKHWYQEKPRSHTKESGDPELQQELVAQLQQISKVQPPE